MVYVDSRNLGYKPYIWTWLNNRPKQAEVDILKSLFDKYVEVSHIMHLHFMNTPRHSRFWGIEAAFPILIVGFSKMHQTVWKINWVVQTSSGLLSAVSVIQILALRGFPASF